MSALGDLVVRVSANTVEFTQGLAKAAYQSEKDFEKMRKDAVVMGAAIGVALTAAAAAVITLTKMAINNADAMHKMAQGAGVSTEAFSELAYVARLSDVSTEQLSTSMGRLNRNILDAAAGTGEAMRAFKALQIDVKNADGSLKSADAVMQEVADKFALMEDGASKSGLALMLFGRAGASMIPMLNGGAEGMKQLRDEARALGVTLDTETGQAAERFNDNLSRLGQVQQGLVNVFMAEMLDSLNRVTDAMVKSASASGELHENIRSFARFLQSTFLTTFQAVVVVGANVKFVLETIGLELYRVAAAAARIAVLDFSGATMIWKTIGEGIAFSRKELDAFEERIMSLKVMSENATAEAAKRTLSIDFSAKEPKSKRENTFAQEIQDAADEEMRVQMEVWALMAEQRDLQLESERAAYDARMEAMMDFHDREQEAAIEAGRVLLEISEAVKAQELQRDRAHLAAKANFMNNLAGLMNTQSSKLFEIGKAAAMAMAAMEGAKAVMSAWKWGMEIGGPPLAGLFAAAAGINAANLINNIRSQQFGSASIGAPASPTQGSSGVAAPVQSVSQAEQPMPQTTIILQGESYTQKQVRELVEALFENSRDGGPRFA